METTARDFFGGNAAFASCSALVARVGENSPPDCFLPLRFACSLLVRIPCLLTQTKREALYLWYNTSLLARCKGWRIALQSASFCRPNASHSVPDKTLLAKNNSPNCFLNAQTLSGFESLALIYSKLKTGVQTKVHTPAFGALQGIRTPDLLVRSQTLYPTELAAHI